MPPEARLCEIFGVSRGILREAIRVLASKGLVEVRQGHGTFVRRPKIDVSMEAVRNYLMTNDFTLAQLMEIRTPLEVEAARLAALRHREDHLGRMEASLATMTESGRSAEEFADADERFHRAIIAASANPLFGIMVRSIMGNLAITRELGIRHFGVEVVREEHREIFAAIRARAPSRAAERMNRHMGMA